MCCFSSSVAGLNSFNVILSGPQHPQNQGPPLGIPCMVLPSPALAPFPVLYSPALPQPAPSASSSLPPSLPLNLGLPNLGSAAHLLISPTTMVNPKSPALPATDPQLPGQCSLNLSPVMSRSHQAVQPESPAYEAQAVSMVKLQQVSLLFLSGGKKDGRSLPWGLGAEGVTSVPC